MNKPFVCILTGPAGAGKSTISHELALRFEKSVVIDKDVIHKMIVGGVVKPWPLSDESKLQESLAIKNIIALAENYLEEGFCVFIDIVSGKKQLQMLKDALHSYDPKVFLLLPNIEALLDRFDKRGKGGDGFRERTKELHQSFTALKDEFELTVVDSSDQTIEETVEEIFQKLL